MVDGIWSRMKVEDDKIFHIATIQLFLVWSTLMESIVMRIDRRPIMNELE